MQTLTDLDLDRDDRRQVVAAMAGSVDELPRIVLDPRSPRPEEGELRPMPDDEATSERRYREQMGAIEATIRGLNAELVGRLEPHDGATLELLCECSATTCSSPVEVSLGDYVEIHQDPDCFIVRHGHQVAAVEDVVASRDDWLVVRTRGVATRDT